MGQQHPRTMRIMVVGESEVGKTSLMMRFIGEEFRNYRETVDFEYEKKPLYMKGEQINLGILDTACIEKFRSVSSMYYTGVRGDEPVNINYNYNLVNQPQAQLLTNDQPSMFASIIGAIASLFESNQRNVNYN